jgi:hypothetical protein
MGEHVQPDATAHKWLRAPTPSASQRLTFLRPERPVMPLTALPADECVLVGCRRERGAARGSVLPWHTSRPDGGRTAHGVVSGSNYRPLLQVPPPPELGSPTDSLPRWKWMSSGQAVAATTPPASRLQLKDNLGFGSCAHLLL